MGPRPLSPHRRGETGHAAPEVGRGVGRGHATAHRRCRGPRNAEGRRQRARIQRRALQVRRILPRPGRTGAGRHPALRFGLPYRRHRRTQRRVQADPDHHAGRRLLRLPLSLQMKPVADVQTFDYIVVGAGSAGAVVANRLSADARHRVLLLEAGPASNAWSRIPVGYARLITNPAANWLYSAEPEANTNGRRLAVPRGRLLGGSSAINGLAFVRGQAQDFDAWARLGNRGWSYSDVLTYFKRMESYAGGGDDAGAFRGRDGPLRVTNPQAGDPLFATLI